MDAERMARLLSRKADGDLGPEEEAELKDALRSDHRADRLVSSWDRSLAILANYAASLGRQPRESAAAASQPRRLLSGPLRAAHLVALAACVLVGFGLGTLIGLSGRAPGKPSVGRPPAPPRMIVPSGIDQMRAVTAETALLMPANLRWVALCDGRLEIGASVTPMSPASNRMWFMTFYVQRGEDSPKEACRLAVIENHQAQLSWDDGGQWRLTVRPLVVGGVRRLAVAFSCVPDGADAASVVMVCEPEVEEGGPVKLSSARSGAMTLALWATVETSGPPVVSDVRGAL